MPLRRCCRSLQIFVAIADEHPVVTSPSVAVRFRLYILHLQAKVRVRETVQDAAHRVMGVRKQEEQADAPSVHLTASFADFSAASFLFLILPFSPTSHLVDAALLCSLSAHARGLSIRLPGYAMTVLLYTAVLCSYLLLLFINQAASSSDYLPLVGNNCNPNNTRLLVDNNQLKSDCGYVGWCDPSDRICKVRGCRRDEWPFGFNKVDRSLWPPLCSHDQFCPDEGSYCMEKRGLGQPCQLSRDGEWNILHLVTCCAHPDFSFDARRVHSERFTWWSQVPSQYLRRRQCHPGDKLHNREYHLYRLYRSRK